MAINANEKFINAILSRVSDYKMTSERKITDLDELNNIMETATGHGYSLSIIKSLYHLIDASAQEYSYENGLKYLISEMTYKNGTNIHTIEQRTLTTDYNNVPITNIVIKRERKAVQQLLISSSKDEIFPEAMKDIEIEKTSIHVNDNCGSVFETYTNLNDSSLMLEKYMQYYPVSNYGNSDKDLLRLCGCGTRYLEIIYHKKEPIYAQLSDKYKVEMADFDPNSSIDAKIIVGKINNEVDSIVTNIHSLIDEYVNKNSSMKKLEKK